MPLSDTQDRLLFVLFSLSPPSWVSLVSPPAYLSCVSSLCLLACFLHVSALLSLSFSAAFLGVCRVFCLSLFCYLFTCFCHCCFVFCCFPVVLVFSRVPFAFIHVMDPFPACPRSASMLESGTTYRLLVDHQLRVVLPAHPDWNRCQCSFGVTSRAALRAAALRP